MHAFLSSVRLVYTFVVILVVVAVVVVVAVDDVMRLYFYVTEVSGGIFCNTFLLGIVKKTSGYHLVLKNQATLL